MCNSLLKNDVSGKLLKLGLGLGLGLCLLAALPLSAYAEGEEESTGDPVVQELVAEKSSAETAADLWSDMEQAKSEGKSEEEINELSAQFDSAMDDLNEEEQSALLGQLTLESEESKWIAITVVKADETAELNSGGYYYLANSITTSVTLNVSGNVRLNLNGNTLTNPAGDAIYLNSGASLYLTDVTAAGKENTGAIVAATGYAINGESSAFVHLNCDSGISSSSSYPINSVYVTNSDNTMAYRQYMGTDNGVSYEAIDIKGKYNGSWITTTYQSAGYKYVSEDLNGAIVTVSPKFFNSGRYIQLNYTVTAGNTAVTSGKLAVHADVQIGDNDFAEVNVIKDSITGKVVGLKLVDDGSDVSSGNRSHTASGCTTKDAQFNLYFSGTGGVTGQSTYWFGSYSDRTSNCMNQVTVNTLTATDSGLALSWQGIQILANESKTFSFLLGIGTNAAAPVWSNTGSGNKENSVSLYVSGEGSGTSGSGSTVTVTASAKDTSGRTNTLYYYVDEGEEQVLNSVTANGETQEITGSIDLSGYEAGTYQLSFWMVNSAGALSPYVVKTVRVNDDNSVTVLEHGYVYAASGNTITETCANGCSHSATVTLTAKDATYTGSEITAALSYSGDAWSGIKPTISYTNNRNAGTATAKLTVLSAAVSDTFTIGKKALTVTADSISRDYGAADPLLTYTAVGLVEGDSLVVELYRTTGNYSVNADIGETAGERVGEYGILFAKRIASDNYDLNTVDGTFTINSSDNLIKYTSGGEGSPLVESWVNSSAEIVETKTTETTAEGNQIETWYNGKNQVTKTTTTYAETGDTETIEYNLDEPQKGGEAKKVTKTYGDDEDGSRTEVYTYYYQGYDSELYYVKQDFEPELIEGNGSVYEAGEAMKFRSDDELCNFQEMRINGAVLDPEYYTVSSGSIRVTLKPYYLATLAPGTYTIDIRSSNGDATGEFTIPLVIYTGPFPQTAPNTGDSSSTMLWLALMCISAAGLASALCLLRRKKA